MPDADTHDELAEEDVELEPVRVAAQAKTEEKHAEPRKNTPKAVKPPQNTPVKPVSKRPAGLGRTAKEVTAPADIQAVKDARKGGLSYEAIEKIEKLNLRQANGMTAYRICKK
jgi:hypothetical protein